MFKKDSQVCVCYSLKCICFLAIALNLPLLAQMCVSLCTFILLLYLFITPFSSGCLIVSACSLALLVAARLIVYFARTAKMLLFLYSVVSVVFFLRSSPYWLMFFITNPPALSTTPQSPTKCQFSVKEGVKQRRRDSPLSVRPPASVCVCARACVCRCMLDHLSQGTVSVT